MSTKYKYGENGSYFDPETKRTYYKDPQYQKAYDDEWNRLEKLYKMKQEEQRRIERENFQRVLAQADALAKSMQALGYRTPLPWEQKNRFDGTKNSEIERAPEDKIYITENSLTGKDEYIRGNGHPVSFDQQTGELVDAITDERTSFDTKLPQEVVITGKKRYNPVYMSSPSALIPLPGILSPSVEEYVKAADNTASALSAANWMDTAYDAMYTPNEINYPWDEGNKGLGSPVLDLGFDFAAYPALGKILGYTGKTGAKAYDAAVRYDVKQRILHDKWEPKNPERFIESLSKSKRPEFLSEYTPETLSDDAFELYKLKGYDIGFALHPNENYYLRDIISVHNNSKRAKNVGDYLIEAAKRKGGSTLDHYDGYLSNFYGNHGFKEYNRLKWNKEFAPTTWDYETYGKPDVVLRAIPDKDLLEIIKRPKK